jgi:hypothetical protein
MAANDTNGNPSDLSATGWAGTDTGHHANGGEAAATAAPPVDDDEIVWQEFSMGEDGQITERSVPSSANHAADRASNPSGPPPPSADPFAARAATAGGASATRDPVADVERALRAYRDALASLGLPHDAGPDSSRASPHGPSFEQSSADLTSTYLRLMQGAGTLPELYASYARFVAASTLLVERQLGLVRMYEQLLAAAAAGRRPVDARRAAEAEYQSFLSSVRDVWSNLDTAAIPPDTLAAMSASMAQAAEAHRAAMLLAGFSTSR